MFQLKFNDDYITTIRDIKYWKTLDDIPINIKAFIQEKSDMRVIYCESNKKFYCAKCIGELDQNNYCEHCNIKHNIYTLEDVKNRHVDIQFVYDKFESNLKLLDTNRYYFVFDIVDSNVYLYIINENISYFNPLTTMPHKNIKLNIDGAYFIEKNGITNLDENDYISYQNLDEYYQKLENNISFEDSSDELSNFDEILMIGYNNSYLYTDNLINLKETIYKYSRIWELSDFLRQKNYFLIAELSLYPLYYHQFEYLVNYKLYNLALSIPYEFKRGKNFKEIFGIDKKYLPFMIKHNINYKEFSILKLNPTMDIETLKLFSRDEIIYMRHLKFLVEECHINLDTLKDYLDKFDSPIDRIYEYLDYIKMARELNLDIANKKVLYPKNLREAHDELYNQLEIVENPEIDKKIRNLAKILVFNNYEDDNYVIFPASSIGDLIEESRQQKNCVRIYGEQIANTECQIYFMRKCENINKSFVTIEVRNNKIVQARLKYNVLPSDEINKILEKWQNKLIPILLEE